MTSTNSTNPILILQCKTCRNIVGDTSIPRSEGTYVVDKVSSLVQIHGDKVTCGDCHNQLGVWSHNKFLLRIDKIEAYKLSEQYSSISKKEFDEYKQQMHLEITNLKDVILSLASCLTNAKLPNSNNSSNNNNSSSSSNNRDDYEMG
jgi:hypothetical protein